MSEPKPSTINHDTAARLINVAPGELEALVKSGAVRRHDKNAYVLPVLVQDFIGYIKAQADRARLAPRQQDIAEHLDMSDRSVREFLSDAGIDHKLATLDEIRIAYIRRLRETAAGRLAEGGLDLATERARLAKEQADKIAYQNAQTRKELAPSYLLEEVLTKTAGRINGILEAIPGAIKRRVQSLSSVEIDMVTDEIAKARNMVAAMRLEDESESDEDDDEGALLEEVA
jgi:phage terminase Nu1 subunit (DNA packaging protein)